MSELIKTITVSQYAALRGCTYQYINKVIKDGKINLLYGIASVTKMGNMYILTTNGTGEYKSPKPCLTK